MSRITNYFDFGSCRAKGLEYAEAKNKCYQLASEAYKNGHKQHAKTLSNRGKYYATLQIESNKVAARKIFNHFNPPDKRSSDKIDLHGLFVTEAIEYLIKYVDFAQERGHRALVVIVGRGIHSEGGAKIKPAVIQYAKEEDIRYQADKPNVGCIRFLFDEPRNIYSHVARTYADYSPAPYDNYSQAMTYENYSPARPIQTDNTKFNVFLVMLLIMILLIYGPKVAGIVLFIWLMFKHINN